mgnify:CR=1 FL=1
MANLVGAKNLTPTQIYKMNKDALQKVLEYRASSYMEMPRRFVRLFANEETQIYNDLLGLSNEKTLSVKDYSSLMGKEAINVTIEIQNVKKEAIYFDNGNWKMDIMLEKEISYTNSCDVLLSAEEYYGAYHSISMTLSWNDSLTSCNIEKLSGKINSKQKPLDEYKVISSATTKLDKKRQNNLRLF